MFFTTASAVLLFSRFISTLSLFYYEHNFTLFSRYTHLGTYVYTFVRINHARITTTAVLQLVHSF